MIRCRTTTVLLKVTLLLLLIGSFNSTKAQDSTSIYCAFFGLDDDAPVWVRNVCPGAFGDDAMPVSFKYSIDETTLSESDFEVIDNMGVPHTPLCAVLPPAGEYGEYRTVLLIGQFGTAVTNPPVEVRVVDDLFTIDKLPEESACSEVINLNGAYTTNVLPLSAGPSMIFAQRIEGPMSECIGGTNQTIQVVWNGGITPFLFLDQEEDLFQYYVGYTDSSGTLIPHVPTSIADINDNDNFHQLCFSTTDPILVMEIVQNVVEDPNGDPNNYSEIEVSYCSTLTSVEEDPALLPLVYSLEQNYPNPFNPGTTIEYSVPRRSIVRIDVFNLLGQKVRTLLDREQPAGSYTITWDGTNTTGQPVSTGVYFYRFQAGDSFQTKKMLLLK
jgi:hypothetical protein